ncbi:aminotransferase class I/II-fold pyridoxal phosphate-dependent enzyme [Fusobacterium varium]|uniref:pyridoxal phosphate-dependent aminotransferase n=1 Tax=Fusobacterium TaxID=848 RepID=UPI001032DAB9|nr:aminotransferase class I/II-fold pyridoxal phosphate-dependent enzyme [Fusobacterium ulcerans]
MLAKGMESRNLVDKVFSVAKKAKEAAEKLGDEKVVNATIGSLYNEEGKLVVLKSVTETYKELPPEEIAGYASAFTGSPEYKESVKRSILGDDYKEEFKNYYMEVIGTPGGTGAVSNSVKNYLNEGDTLLLPKWLWSPYILMASERKGNCEYYTIFDENGKFDLNDFSERIFKLAEKQDNVVVIINDPCQNPTGYKLTIDEWKNVLNIFEKATEKANIILINDIAYIDFDDRNEEEKKEYRNLFKNLSSKILVIFAFSISKALTSYGLRVGAQLALSSDKEVINEFEKANSYSCRSTWSNISRGGMKMFSDIILDKEKYKVLKEEREMYRLLIKERADIFLKEAEECGLKLLPYKTGFFLTIPIGELTDKVAEVLERENIYTVVLDEGIRIAVCSVTKKKITGLAGRIKKAIDKVSK